jgi:hypothetical protein
MQVNEPASFQMVSYGMEVNCSAYSNLTIIPFVIYLFQWSCRVDEVHFISPHRADIVKILKLR